MKTFLIVSFIVLASILGYHYTQWKAAMPDRVAASVVRITGKTAAFNIFQGPVIAPFVCTGFVIADHIVLTANHCMSDDPILADGFPTKVIKKDEYFDLALLEAPGLNKPYLVFRLSAVKRYEHLVALGYGFGLTSPLIIREEALLTNYANGSGSGPVGILTQGGFVGGMSGGPQVDTDGKVVSIIQQTNMGVGFGVSYPIIEAFLVDAGLEQQ